MYNKKIFNAIMTFIMAQPLFDSFIYLINKVLCINVPLLSFIRPVIAVLIYLYLLSNKNIKKKNKIATFVYLCIYLLYTILHLVNIKNNFYNLSYGTLGDELRYLFNYGYFLLQLINFSLMYKVSNKEDKRKLILSVIYAIVIMCILYFLSIFTRTSERTYLYSLKKNGWKGWSVSSHYIGHCIVYTLPIIIYSIFEKGYIKKWYKYIIMLLVIIPAFYLVGTKTPLFAVLAIIIFYTIMQVIDCIKKKKLNLDTSFFIILTIVLLSTFKLTFGYENFENQLHISDGDDIGVDLISDNLNDDIVFNEIERLEIDKEFLSKFENRMTLTLYKYRNIKSSVFDNRTIQKTLNRYLWKVSPIEERLLGYGHNNMPICTWVETDLHTIFYCYGIIGFLLIIVIPLGYISINGLKALFNIKNMTREKIILGFGYGISLFIIYSVGYTMQFAQTVFYLIILLILSDSVFKEKEEKNMTKDYLFAINDLNIGGAEVGMVDVVNELAKKGKKVDIVLLRKRGPLLERLDKRINVYEILNKDYSIIKRKIYHILYILGGPFIKYVYKKTIKCEYKNEIAYLEGYPAVFISASDNDDSVKIASIRVGLKSHKLKASKYPWGEYVVKKAYKKMDNIYTVSDLTTKEFLEKYPFCKNKTTTIYTYFNVEDIKNKANEKYDFKYDKTKINFLAVGRFSKQKSYDRLIKAFEEVSEKYENVLLHFIGNHNTEEGKKLLSLIKENNLEEKIIIHGVKENPYPYIKDCDVLISSSLYEGFPRVINEAISLEKLCIGTNVTGTKEALHEGKLGILVEDSINGLIEGMSKYIDNPEIYLEYKEEIKKFDGNKEHYFSNLKKLTYKKKNMIIYMPKLSYGGMEKALVNLINYTSLNEKYNLTLYLIYKGEMNYIDLLPQNIKLIVACPNKWNTLGKIISIIKLGFRYIYHIFNKYDIAVSYSYQHPVLTSLTRLSSENNVVYIHGNLQTGTELKLLKKRLRKCKYEKFKKIICVSEDSKKALIKLINRKENIFVVNNVIDGDKIIEASEEKINDFEFEKDKIYFINICRHFEKHKRLYRIIEATNKLNKEGYKFEVVFIGDGEDHKLYEDKIKELNINNIHLIGKKKNPYKYLKKGSCLLLSSIREGYPVVFVESMVLNKPIVTTNVSDAKKDIDGNFGIVVDNDDTSIYKGMKEFIENGYKIKKKFDYLKFNKKIEEQVDIIYNKD